MTSGLRVTLVNYTLSMMRGGGETRDLAFARHLTDLGCQITLVSVNPLLGRVRHPIHGFNHRLIRSPYFRDLVYRFMVLPKTGRLASFLLDQDVKRFSRGVIDLVADPAYPVDILQVAGLYPAVAVKQRRDVKVVVRNQGGLPRAWMRHWIPQADAVIGDGWDAENFERSLGTPLVEIPGGVDSELFRPGDGRTARRELGLADQPLLLYVGRFVPLKNLPMLLSAFALVRQTRPDAVLALAGEGALEGQLRRQVRDLGIENGVRFLGQKPQADLPALYAASDVVLLSSSFDNSPNAVLEAGACGRPVVATRVGGVARYVDEGETGYLVDSGDHAAFANRILALLDDPVARERMGANGRRRVETRHSWRKSCEKLLSLYESLLGRAPAGSGRIPG
ncbi:MAG: glycosyltransferase family 4 protein [Chloroflexota bacterium]